MKLFIFVKSLEKDSVIVLPRKILHRNKCQVKISDFLLHINKGFSPLCFLGVHNMAGGKNDYT